MSSSTAATVDRPNLLFLFADQMHGFAMGCMGHPDLRTPNLDRLAASGTLYRNAYSNVPVCTPFRAVLMSGRHGCQLGLRGNNGGVVPEGHWTLPRGLNTGGYHTSYVGKWHLGATGNQPITEPQRMGFRSFIGYQCYNSFVNEVNFYDEAGTERRCDPVHRTTATTDIALERLDAVRDERFAMFVSYQNPHYPCEPIEPYDSWYRGADLTVRPNHRPETEPWTPTYSPPSKDPAKDAAHARYGGRMRRYLECYYAMVSHLDAQVGRILDWLDETGLAATTAVVFTSDHGDMQGSHGLTNKCHIYEESARIPCIVRTPGDAAAGRAGRVLEDLVAGIDYVPTLLELGGCDVPALCEGRSFAPNHRTADGAGEGSVAARAAATSAAPRPPVFVEAYAQDLLMWRDGDWKYTMTREGREPRHLFNLAADPYELANLIEAPAHAPRRLALHEALCAYHDRLLATPAPWLAAAPA